MLNTRKVSPTAELPANKPTLEDKKPMSNTKKVSPTAEMSANKPTLEDKKPMSNTKKGSPTTELSANKPKLEDKKPLETGLSQAQENMAVATGLRRLPTTAKLSSDARHDGNNAKPTPRAQASQGPGRTTPASNGVFIHDTAFVGANVRDTKVHNFSGVDFRSATARGPVTIQTSAGKGATMTGGTFYNFSGSYF